MKSHVLRTGLVVLLFLSSLAAAQTSKPALPESPSTAKADYSQEPYVVERLKTVYRFQNDGTGSRQTDIRVKVQNEAGLEQLGQIVLGYSSASERVEVNYVRVIKADGSVVNAGPDAIQDLTAPVAQVAPVYTDFRQKHITVPGLRPGETLEYSYTTVFQKPLAAGQFWAQHDFETTSIVLDEQLDIDIPRARTVKLKVKPEYPPKILDAGDRRTYHWTSSHLVPETSEERKKKRKKRGAGEEEDRPAVQMSTFSSWEEVGRWYASLEKDRRAFTPQLKAKAEELTKDKKTDLEKLQALYDFVAKNFRYVSLSFGVGRYQPHAASEVFSNQYGDCKDKHTLLEALAEAIGLHPWSVLINSSRKLDPDVPSPSQFDHVITLVPVGGDMVWLDTTTEVAPFRLLSFNIRDKQALAIPPDGSGRLMTTPAGLPFEGSQKVDISGKITDLGRLEATVSYTMHGDAELLLRMLFRRVPAARWNDLVKVLAQADGFNPESASNLKADSPDDTDHPFHLSYSISQPNYLDWSSKKARLDLPIPHMRLVVPDADDDANEPLKLGPVTLASLTLKLELPDKYTAQAPLPVAMQRDFGRYQASYKLQGNVLTAERTLQTNVSELPSARISEFLSFRRTLTADEGQQVSLESATAGSGKELQGMKAEDLHEAGIDALRSNNFKLAAELFQQVVQQEPKHKFAWNNLGRAYMGLGEYDKAASAIRKQIEINPYDEFAYNNLGRVFWLQQKYDEAAAAFRKQIEVDPLDKFAHSNLGSILIEQKKYADAIPELEKAVNLTPDDPLLVTNLGRAYLNNNQTDKALQTFDRAVELAPAPPVWNNIAYELSLKKVSLERAQRYAESAVTATAAALRNLSLDRVTLQDIGQVASIQSYWDTLGWVYFQLGDAEKAEKYVRAAWVLGGHGEVGDHLGQIYEKLGDKQKAIDTYVEALTARNKVDSTRAHLGVLVGDTKIDGLVKQVAATPDRLGSITLNSPKKLSGAADFFVLLVPGPKVEGVKFISGSDDLKSMGEVLQNATYGLMFPDGGDAKLIRRGTLTCTATENPVASQPKGKKAVVAAAEKTKLNASPASGSTCKFVLVDPEDVRSVE